MWTTEGGRGLLSQGTSLANWTRAFTDATAGGRTNYVEKRGRRGGGSLIGHDTSVPPAACGVAGRRFMVEQRNAAIRCPHANSKAALASDRRSRGRTEEEALLGRAGGRSWPGGEMKDAMGLPASAADRPSGGHWPLAHGPWPMAPIGSGDACAAVPGVAARGGPPAHPGAPRRTPARPNSIHSITTTCPSCHGRPA